MAKTDWNLHDTVQPEDMNALGSEINRQGTGISKLEDRLNIAEYEDITLQPGLQVINAKRDSRFRLGEIKGRTLINLLGVGGDCENPNALSVYYFTTGTLDTANKKYGSASLKITITGTTQSGVSAGFRPISYRAGSYYVMVADFKNGNLSNTNRVAVLQSVGATNMKQVSLGYKSDVADFTPIVTKLNPTVDEPGGSAELVLFGAVGEYGYVDGFRIYEISEGEYAALDSMSPQQIGAKYPFVPSGIVGVGNPYAIGYGENLLPPFYEWTVHANSRISDPYTLTHTPLGAANEYDEVWIPVLPSVKFTLTNGFGMQIIGFDSSRSITTDTWYPTSNNAQTYSTSAATNYFRIRVNVNNTVGVMTITNPMLTLGSTPKPFKPCKDTMLALQTNLYANPVDVSEPDVLFEREGQYFKLAKWKKVILDGSLDWRPNSAVSFTGYKRVTIPFDNSGGVTNSQTVTKYNGKKLTNWTGSTEQFTAGDQFAFNTGFTHKIQMTISNADSGWGDAYTPTVDEIKAYFIGWKMYEYGTQASKTSVYSRSDGANKGWTAVNGDYTVGYNALPASVAPGYSPYNLLYRLAKETVEPVVSEGALTLQEGGNVVEVGTGIVLREHANPKQHTNTNWIINSIGSAYDPLLNKVEYLKLIYRNSKRDYGWSIESSAGVFGNQYAYIPNSNFDQYASYSVTYTKLDKSPIQPITGTLASNEKAQLSDLTTGVAKALQRVSVVEQKKAEKDASSWITPTLLNGIAFNSSSNRNGYYKDSSGRVYISFALIASGNNSIPQNTQIFRLPDGYRPSKTVFINGFAGNSQGLNSVAIAVSINPDGYVALSGTNTNYMALVSNIFSGSFLAEQ